LFNVHAAPDAFELERISSTRKSYRRQLTALEEMHVAQGDAAVNMIASVAAQMQVWCGHTAASVQAVHESLFCLGVARHCFKIGVTWLFLTSS
jgi:hypothetical protein